MLYLQCRIYYKLTLSAALVRHCTTACRCSLLPYVGSFALDRARMRRPTFLIVSIASSEGLRAESGRRNRLSTNREYAMESMPNASKRASSQ